jgi:cytochrome P450
MDAPSAAKPAATRLFYRQWQLITEPHRFFDALASEYGDFAYYRGLIPFYFVNDAERVKQILKQTTVRFDKRTPLYRRFRGVFRSGLVVSEGDHWQRQRRLMQPMFAPAALKRYFGVMDDCVTEFQSRWDRLAADGSAFDLFSETSNLTLEVAGRSLFSDGFEGARDEIEQWSRRIARYSALPPLPPLDDVRIPTPLNLRMQRDMRRFRQFVQDKIDARRSQPDTDDLLTRLMQAARDEGSPISDGELVDEVVTMIFGGFETSSMALVWFWYLMSRHPDVETRILDEINTTLGERRPERADLANLPLLRASIEEALRLYPPFWFENRRATEAVDLGGYTIPAGAMVVFSRHALHRSPHYWREPATFRPERFLADAAEPVHRFASVPFGGGPRQCIGMSFAMMELMLTLARTLPRYRLFTDASGDIDTVSSLTLEPSRRLQATLTRRDTV